MMSLPFDANAIIKAIQNDYTITESGVSTMNAFVIPESNVVPFEFRSLAGEDLEELELLSALGSGARSSPHGTGDHAADQHLGRADLAIFAGTRKDRGATEAVHRSAVDAARQEGLRQGELEGRNGARTEMVAEMNRSVAQERQLLANSLDQFRGAKDCYFIEVEQEVVRLALAIAARVLHREAQIDPLLLTGAVRVALEKMADRSGVVLRVTGQDVEAWEGVFHSVEASVRPKVVEDSRLGRGECVLDTQMGTVELGVHVQLEEIEKGFFDLLNHRPVE